MAPYQLDAIFCRERYGVVEASTKAGKTVGCMVWLAEQAMASKRGRHFWWVAPVFPQTRIAFERLKHGLPAEMYVSNEGQLTITLKNGAIIDFKSGDNPDSLFGQDVYAAVIDEGSRLKEDAWHAVRSTLTQTRGPLRIIGNVKGRRNWFYHLARRAQSGERDMHYAKITAYDAIAAGVLDPAEIEDAQRVLPDAVFRELYLAEPSDDGGNPFGLSAIDNCIGPLSSEQPVCWGVDLAKSQDWTVAIALDAQGRCCGFERWQAPWQETIERVKTLIAGLPALVDSTGVGDPIVETLQRGSGPNFEGYKFTAPSKQKLMEGLAVAIQQGQITFPAGPIADELEVFEYEYTRGGVRYSAPDGLHDDCVMALALAVRKHPALGRLQEGLAVFEYTKKLAATTGSPSFTFDFNKYPQR